MKFLLKLEERTDEVFAGAGEEGVDEVLVGFRIEKRCR
jgi:hypothetical protein